MNGPYCESMQILGQCERKNLQSEVAHLQQEKIRYWMLLERVEKREESLQEKVTRLRYAIREIEKKSHGIRTVIYGVKPWQDAVDAAMELLDATGGEEIYNDDKDKPVNP